MHARKQIDEAAYLAGREYQKITEQAGIAGAVRSVNLEAPAIDGHVTDHSITDGQRRAFARLRQVDGELALRHGTEALWLVRAVLVDKTPVERIAAAQGITSNREVRFVGRLFRRSLNALAELLGFAGQARGRRPAEVDKWTLAAVSVAVRAAG
jgi:hypothetical protein